MKEFFFWKVWSPSERRMTIAAFAVLFLALLFFIIKSIDPLSNVIRWNVLSELSETPSFVDVFQLGQWKYGVAVPSHLVTESFISSVMETDFLVVQLHSPGFRSFWLRLRPCRVSGISPA
jgi:hypothetical protein